MDRVMPRLAQGADVSGAGASEAMPRRDNGREPPEIHTSPKRRKRATPTAGTLGDPAVDVERVLSRAPCDHQEPVQPFDRRLPPNGCPDSVDRDPQMVAPQVRECGAQVEENEARSVPPPSRSPSHRVQVRNIVP